MRSLMHAIAVYVSNMNNYTKDQEEQIEYVMKLIVFEILKFLGTIMIFSFLGYQIQVLIIVITIGLIKPFIGGYHEDSQIACFLATLIITSSIIYLSTNLDTGLGPKLVIFVACIFSIWSQAPIINPKMPITRLALFNRNKITGLIITSVAAIISIALYKNIKISNSITWTIVYLTLFMFEKSTVKNVKANLN